MDLFNFKSVSINDIIYERKFSRSLLHLQYANINKYIIYTITQQHLSYS